MVAEDYVYNLASSVTIEICPDPYLDPQIYSVVSCLLVLDIPVHGGTDRAQLTLKKI